MNDLYVNERKKTSLQSLWILFSIRIFVILHLLHSHIQFEFPYINISTVTSYITIAYSIYIISDPKISLKLAFHCYTPIHSNHIRFGGNMSRQNVYSSAEPKQENGRADKIKKKNSKEDIHLIEQQKKKRKRRRKTRNKTDLVGQCERERRAKYKKTHSGLTNTYE